MPRSQPEMRQMPPAAIEHEESVMVSMLLYPETLPDIVDFLQPSDFYRKAHSRIYEQILEAHNAGKPVSLIDITTRLRDAGTLESVGGAAYLAHLVATCPAAPNIKHYIKSIKQKSVNRQIIQAANEITKIAYESPGEDCLDQAQSIIMGIKYEEDADVIGMKALMHEALERYEEKHQNQGITGEPYGFVDLDFVTCGMQPGDLIIVAARPGLGKSAFIENVAKKTTGPVAMFSLEMSREQQSDRFISSESKVDSTKLRTGRLSPDDWQKISVAAGVLSEKEIYINDDPSVDVGAIRRATRSLVRTHGVKVCMVDYMQLMNTAKNERRDLELGEVSRGLKLMARELKMPVVALSQLNRKCEERQDKRPMLSDIRESGNLEADADVVLMLYRDEVYYPDTEDQNIIEVAVKKQRMGPTTTVKLYWDGKTTTVKDLGW